MVGVGLWGNTSGLAYSTGLTPFGGGLSDSGGLSPSGVNFTPTIYTDFTQTGSQLPGQTGVDGSGNVLSPNYTYQGLSLRTITDATGAITYAPNNLLTYSNTFTNAAWYPGPATVATTSATTDPVGGTNAYVMQATGPSPNISQTISPGLVGVNVTYSVYAKYVPGSLSPYLLLQLGFSSYAAQWFNVQTGVVGTNAVGGGATLLWANISAVGNGWYLCSASVNIPAVPLYMFIAVARTNGGYDGNSPDQMYIYQAAASAATYETAIRPGDQVITTGASFYGPAFDYSPTSIGTPLGLRVEEGRTNVALQSQNFGTTWAIGVGVGTVTTSYATGPDGVSTSAARLQIASGPANSTALSQTVANAASETNTVSVYVKSNTGSNQTFSLKLTQAGVADHFSSDLMATPSWQRFTFSAAFGSGGTGTFIGFASSSAGAAADLQIFGYQAEFNTSFPTSYIPTGASTVSRAADVMQIVGTAATTLGNTKGALVVKTKDGQASHTATLVSANGVVMLGETSANNLTTAVGTALTSSNTATWTAPNDSGLGWSATAGTVDLNATATSDANARTPSAPFYLGSTSGSSAFYDGHFGSIAIYNSYTAMPQ